MRGGFAREVWTALRVQWESKQSQVVNLESRGGTHTTLMYTNNSVCPTPTFKPNYMITKDNPLVEQCAHPWDSVVPSSLGSVDDPIVLLDGCESTPCEPFQASIQPTPISPPVEAVFFATQTAPMSVHSSPQITTQPTPISSPQRSILSHLLEGALHLARCPSDAPLEVKALALFRFEGGERFAQSAVAWFREGRDTTHATRAMEAAALRVCEYLSQPPDFGLALAIGALEAAKRTA